MSTRFASLNKCALAFVLLVGGIAGADQPLDPNQLSVLADFARYVATHRHVSSSSTETTRTFTLQEFLDSAYGGGAENLNGVARLYPRFTDDLSLGGPEVNQLLRARPDLEAWVRAIVEALLFRADYESLRGRKNDADLFAVNYPEPLRSIIVPLLAEAAADLVANARAERHVLSAFAGLGVMAAVELPALFLQMAHVIHVDLNTSLASIPALTVGGWAACELLLMRKASSARNSRR